MTRAGRRSPGRAGALTMALAAAACVPTPKPPATPAVRAAPPPAALVPPSPPATDWRDLPLTSGSWHYAATPAGSAARFGATAATAVFEIRCDKAARQVVLTLVGQPGGGLTLRTSYRESNVLFRAEEKEAHWAFSAADRTLDEIAFSRGRFTLAVTGRAPVVLPAWAEPARVIEDCRG